MSYLHAAALLIAMLLGAAGGWGIKGVRADAAVNAATQRAVKVELALAAERAAWQAASRASTEEQRAEEQRRQAAKDKEVRDAQEQARLDAARAAPPGARRSTSPPSSPPPPPPPPPRPTPLAGMIRIPGSLRQLAAPRRP